MPVPSPAGARWAAAATLVTAAIMLAGCTWPGPGEDAGRYPGDPGARQGEPADRRSAHTVVGRADGRAEASFVLTGGSDAVRVRAADLGGDLYRVATPADSRISPVVRDDGTVRATLVGSGQHGGATVEVLLSRAVRWRVELAGGAAEEVVDLAAAPGAEAAFSAGATRIEVVLPAPHGTSRVSLTGGASQVQVTVAAGPPVRVRAGGGAGSVTVDGATRSGVAGGTVLTPPDWAGSADRYDIDAASGVSTLTVRRH